MTDTYLIEDSVNELDPNLFKNSKSKGKTEFLYIDDDKLNSGDGYLMPRLGSNISNTTTNSANSNTPLLKNTKYEFTVPAKAKSKKAYSPSPPPIKSNKLTLNTDSNETNV